MPVTLNLMPSYCTVPAPGNRFRRFQLYRFPIAEQQKAALSTKEVQLKLSVPPESEPDQIDHTCKYNPVDREGQQLDPVDQLQEETHRHQREHEGADEAGNEER